MIGVIPKSGDLAVVEEFFELFKTPWELYRSGRTYDVIIATADDLPKVNAKLLLVYGPREKSIDAQLGFAIEGSREDAVLNDRDVSFPIYSEVSTFADRSVGETCVRAGSAVAGITSATANSTVVRLGYDLFDEIKRLLSTGQPVDYAHIPTLDVHIRMLRGWILNEGIPLIEIPPVPMGHTFVVCLTHDIDFVGIRNHKFDHTMWGFLYRSTLGSIQNLLRGRTSLASVFKAWKAAASLPLVYLGWAHDFWEPFEFYLRVEKGLGATYFLIPFKGRAGEKVAAAHASRRAAAYDLRELTQSLAELKAAGCELAVHGIDAWHSVEKGREERARLAEVTTEPVIGVRMHWLLQDSSTPSVLEQSGYSYDATAGYNETVGYRAGTGQVFRPSGAKTLLELPTHIQDGALFYPQRLDLSEPEAERRCRALLENAGEFGGVLTIIWHDRSHAAERFWGDFYIRLVQELKSSGPWFATAHQAVWWFQKRRQVRFESRDGTAVRALGSPVSADTPSLRVRIHRTSAEKAGTRSSSKSSFVDMQWDGQGAFELPATFQGLSEIPVVVPAS